MDTKEKTIVKLIQKALTNDLRKPNWRNNQNKMAGHSYVAAEAAFYLIGKNYKLCSMRHENRMHWYLLNKEDVVIDPTVGQFKNKPDYSQGVFCDFFTKVPSKNAAVVIDRVTNMILSGRL